MRPELIVGNEKLWIRSEWMFYRYSSVIFFHFFLQRFTFFILTIFYVVFLCINKVSIIMVIFHRVDMVVWILKVDWVQFLLIMRNVSLRRICVGCTSVFLEVFRLWYIYMIVLKELFYGWLFFMKKAPLKVQVSCYTSCYINNSLTHLLLSTLPRQ